jgi:glucosyl-3-phosphoglycerate synthase
MPDLLQPGPVLSLPLLHSAAEKLDADLTAWSRKRPLALLLPCHVRDLEGPALTNIIAVLSEVPWIARVIVGLDGADDAGHAGAAEKFGPLGPRCELLHRSGMPGKGRNLGDCAAHALREAGLFALAMHDCDIASYSREFLARLCWPVLHPDAGLAACKGTYARSAAGLHGRVFRLLFQPLLRAWADLSPSPWTEFLQSLRYPLAGELCVRAATLRHLTFADGWGVEVKLLHELFRHAGPAQICQAELCAAYDHKHQAPRDLIVMAGQVARALRESMPAENSAADPAALRAACERHSSRAVRDSLLTAAINDLPCDEPAEHALAAEFLAVAFAAQ